MEEGIWETTAPRILQQRLDVAMWGAQRSRLHCCCPNFKPVPEHTYPGMGLLFNSCRTSPSHVCSLLHGCPEAGRQVAILMLSQDLGLIVDDCEAEASIYNPLP